MVEEMRSLLRCPGHAKNMFTLSREIRENVKWHCTCCTSKNVCLTEYEMPQRSVMMNFSSGCPGSPSSLKTNSIWSVPHPKKSSTWTELTPDHWEAIWIRQFKKATLEKHVNFICKKL